MNAADATHSLARGGRPLHTCIRACECGQAQIMLNHGVVHWASISPGLHYLHRSICSLICAIWTPIAVPTRREEQLQMVVCKLLLLLLSDASVNLSFHPFFFGLAYRVPSSPAQTRASRHGFWRLGLLVWLGLSPGGERRLGFETPGLFEVLQQGLVFSAVDTSGFACEHEKSCLTKILRAFEDVKNGGKQHLQKWPKSEEEQRLGQGQGLWKIRYTR
ncbi:hypothetical protein ACQKWADRAFT_83981 [Trichoderma austrokoningii]